MSREFAIPLRILITFLAVPAAFWWLKYYVNAVMLEGRIGDDAVSVPFDRELAFLWPFSYRTWGHWWDATLTPLFMGLPLIVVACLTSFALTTSAAVIAFASEDEWHAAVPLLCMSCVLPAAIWIVGKIGTYSPWLGDSLLFPLFSLVIMAGGWFVLGVHYLLVLLFHGLAWVFPVVVAAWIACASVPLAFAVRGARSLRQSTRPGQLLMSCHGD